MMNSTPEQTVKAVNAEHSSAGWFFHNSWQGIKSFFGKHPIRWGIIAIVLILLALFMRWFFQPFVLNVRIYSGAILLTLAVTGLLLRSLKNRSPKVRHLLAVVGFSLIAFGTYMALPLNQYITSYLGYGDLKIINLSSLPHTADERILPLNAVDALARERMDESEFRITTPDLVHSKDGDFWTLAIEPARTAGRITGSVSEIVKVQATSATPDFSRRNPIKVNFPTGERMMLSNNLHTCVQRSFGLLQYLSYEPGNVLYMQDDKGEWVQVVSLIKWTGIFFPRPDFGGVQVIRQDNSGSLANNVNRALFGCGKYISPEKIRDYAFLRGQNLVAPRVMRFIAESFRFQAGFTGPMSWVHKDDIRIPSLPSDVNPQPFNLNFILPGQSKGSLFAYFALEPSDPNNKGLASSLFVPSDNPNVVYQYPHAKRGARYIGVSAVEAKVEESKKMFDWTKFRPVEHRPYIRTCRSPDGKLRQEFWWMTSVVAVTKKNEDGSTSDFTVGAIPDLVFTNASTSAVTWPTSKEGTAWKAELNCLE
ncbi:hypothetical protein [Acinetobacter sp.]|uniref:hypothetical protein n=1 Tax=Acinetobacter sp. TaxID=472 RepID=UPI0037527CEE